MRYSTSYLTDQLQKLQLDAEEVKQAQLTSQNSGMLGFQAQGARQAVNVPALGTSVYVVYSVRCRFWAGKIAGVRNQPQTGTVIYPSVDFSDAQGNRSEVVTSGSQVGQSLTLRNATGAVIGSAYANYLIDGFTRVSPTEWTTNIITHSDVATTMTVTSEARSTVPGWIEMEVTRR